MTQTARTGWIITGVQATIVTIFSTIIISVGGNLISSLVDFKKSVDELKGIVADIKKNDARQDTSLAVHQSLISNRQQAEWQLDKKTDGLQIDNQNIHSDIDKLYAMIINKK